MNALAKLKKKWHRDLKRWFADNEIRRCEQCGSTEPPLDMSHRKKQRFILDRDEYFKACLLCRRCHEKAEYAGHTRLLVIHDQIIKNRFTEPRSQS